MDPKNYPIPQSGVQNDHEIPCDCTEEQSFCNCENTERITNYQADCNTHTAEPLQAEHTKCGKLKRACKRLSDDLRACNGNPYIKDTLSYRVDLYKNPQDSEPVDHFQMQKSKCCSLRTLGLLASAAVVLILTVKLIQTADTD